MICHCSLAGTAACKNCSRYKEYFGEQKEINKLPTIESRAKGTWIAYAENNTPIMLRCSMCTHSVVWGSIAKYCPNCGAEMEKI